MRLSATSDCQGDISLAGEYYIIPFNQSCKKWQAVCARVSHSECDEYIRIFEYFGHKYLFGHLIVSNFLIQIYSDIHSCKNVLYESECDEYI